MKKANLILGRKYLHRRRTVIAGIPRQAERWLRCERFFRYDMDLYSDLDGETIIRAIQEKVDREMRH